METLTQPIYDPKSVTPGIAHFGVGNFHRSHQAMYLDRLISEGDHNDWGIVGIGVMPGDIAMRNALAGQDHRYTLVQKHGDGSVEARQIASIRGFLYAQECPSAVLNLLTDPAIRIVSLTITEGGYNIDPNGEFNLTSPRMQADLADPTNPTTVFGYITEALRIRQSENIAPFTVMSCDNLPGNGDVARRAILTFAGAIDPLLATWIDDHVAFPNSMVDRITPVTTDDDRRMVSATFGVDDAWPVVTEPFTQWVLEDQFCNGRPAFERVGVQVVNDVAPYELMKLRLLNASHQAMAYIGLLRGHIYVHEAVADKEVEHLLRAWLEEARTTLAPVHGIDVDDYIDSLFERFRNLFIADTLARLAVDASDRVPKFVLPAVRENLAAGRPISAGVGIVAYWAKYLSIADGIVDPLAGELVARAKSPDPLEFIHYRTVFGDLGSSEEFTQTYQTERSLLY